MTSGEILRMFDVGANAGLIAPLVFALGLLIVVLVAMAVAGVARHFAARRRGEIVSIDLRHIDFSDAPHSGRRPGQESWPM